MNSANFLIALAAVVGLGILSATSLRGWQGWLALKQRELDSRRPEIEGGASSGQGAMTSRIEIADLKERIRKLEAIAAGVDL